MEIKKVFYIIGLTGGVLAGGIAYAQDDLRFYLGGDLGYGKVKSYDDAKNAITAQHGTYSTKEKSTSFGILAGLRYCENFGTELGYTSYKKLKYSFSLPVGAINNNGNPIDGSDNGTIKANNISLDLLGYMPIGKDVELIGSVGLGRVKFKDTWSATGNLGQSLENLYGASSMKLNKTGYRLGLGVQYKFIDYFATRAMVKYQKVGKKNGLPLAKNITTVNLSVIYNI